MNKIKSLGFVILLIGGVVYFSNHKKSIKQLDETSVAKTANIEKLENKTAIKNTNLNELPSSSNLIKSESLSGQTDHQKNTIADKSAAEDSFQIDDKTISDQTLTYTIDDGLAVVQGDIVIGKISPDTILTSFSGPTKEPPIKLWPTTEIPYYVQPNLRNPERVAQALKYFSNTNIHFVPYANQEDIIVFEQGYGTCKSYLGHIGGRQPLWISEGCSARDIAHEIMHSLGFIHEQNRNDRDNYINVYWENINSKFKINFEKFSSSSMRVTGLSQFDFESIMIYPELMFSINGLPTIRSKINEQVVFPSHVLSSKDIERVNKAYVK